jgi:hypothetical protein
MKRLAALLGLAGILVPLLLSCGDKETPEQRLARLRSRHEIYPVGTTVRDIEGVQTLIVDLHVANQGTEPLGQLTVLLRIDGADGTEKVSQRVTLDLADLRPGIGERRVAMIPGVTLAEDDQVFVELEANLPTEELHGLPEWSEVS